MSTLAAKVSRGVDLTWARAPQSREGRRTVAWQLARDLLAARGAPDATLSHACPTCGGPHGPVLVDGPWTASVTYAAGWAIAGIAPASVGALGIDAEPVDDAVRDADGWARDRAIAPLRWVRIEAALKADGRGLAVDPWAVSIEAVDAHAGEWRALVPGRDRPMVGFDAPAPPGILLSVAIEQDPAEPEARSGRATR